MRLLLPTVALLLGVFLGAQAENNASIDTGIGVLDAHQVVAKACNDFSTSLYKAMSSEPGNMVMSPLSVESLMALTWMGATGETARELGAGLHLPENKDHVALGFNFLLSFLENTDTITLDIANKIYVQKGYKLKETFRQTAVENFQSDAEEVNFLNAEAARVSINKWVENKTHDRIKDLVAPGALGDDTRLLAVNAIYFRGGWLKPFNESDTTVEPFYTTPSTSVNVSMMHTVDYFLYGDLPELNAYVLKLFYRGSAGEESFKEASKSMLILLPAAVDGLAALEAKITSLNVSDISNRLSKRQLILSLPKFKVESTLKLADSLQQLGISRVFKPGAELSGISDDQVYINKVIQKAYIEVTEKGTEAAAATYVELVNFIGSTPSEMNINHPFVFLIMDEPSNAVIFMGRVQQP